MTVGRTVDICKIKFYIGLTVVVVAELVGRVLPTRASFGAAARRLRRMLPGRTAWASFGAAARRLRRLLPGRAAWASFGAAARRLRRLLPGRAAWASFGAAARRLRRLVPGRAGQPSSGVAAEPSALAREILPERPLARLRVPVSGDLSQLVFGTASRARARHKRTLSRLAAVAVVAGLLGVPGARFGVDLVAKALGGNEGSALRRSDLQGVTTSESAEGMMRMRGNLFQSRPTPTPTPTEEPGPEPEAAPVEPAPTGSVTEIVYAAAAEFGLNGGYLLSVASCESGLNPGAVNPVGYHGLFQFDSSTWAAYGYGSIYDPVAQARTAARMLASGMASRWPNCA